MDRKSFVIYYRKNLASFDEIEAMKANFDCVTSRMKVKNSSLCIARYTAVPNYKELEQDLECIGAKLINTYKQHIWIADLGNWTETLCEFTPETWNSLENVPNSAFPIIVKGETTSKKFNWNTCCYAKDRCSAANVMCNLLDDMYISEQKIYFRKYIHLKTYLIGLCGLPVTKEFRVFVCNGKELCRGYYWSNYIDDLPEKPNAAEIPKSFLQNVINCIGNNAIFYTIDIGQKEDGEWVVIEVNDGQQSGLSECNPFELYKNLKEVLENDI